MNKTEQEFIAKLYIEARPKLLDYGRRMCSNHEQIEDAVSEAFRLACEKIDYIMAHPSPEAWMMKTFQKVLYRSEYKEGRHAEVIEKLKPIAAEEPLNDPANNADILYSGLDDNEDYKLIKRLSESRGSIADLARDMGEPNERVKKKVQRARSRLQKILKTHYS